MANDAQIAEVQTTKLTLDVDKRTLELLGREAQADRRSRKRHIELVLDKHAERYERRQKGEND